MDNGKANSSVPPTDAGGDPIMRQGSVAGEFNGHFINGHVIGAFGAMKQDE